MTTFDYSNYLFFYGHEKQDGYLSNFYETHFIVDGLKYVNSEQFFMKKKQEYFDPTNVTLGNKIMKETDPKKIKSFGRKVNNYDDIKWSQVRYDFMKTGLIHKFSQNNIIKQKLLNTGNKILVEASPYDNIWGIGLSKGKAMTTTPDNWQGTNLLGKALMEIRLFLI